MWIILAAPWLPRRSRRAASAFRNCWTAVLQHTSASPSIFATHLIRWSELESTAACRVAFRAANSMLRPRGAIDRFPRRNTHPAALETQRNPHFLSSTATMGLLPRVATLHYTTDTPSSNPPGPAISHTIAPSPHDSATSGPPSVHAEHRPAVDVAAAPASMSAAVPTPGHPGSGLDSAAVASSPSASSSATAGPGPSSAVLQLMRHIRRSRSAVDLRVLLTQNSAVVDHLALVAAMTRVAQLAGTSRRAADRAALRELLSELAGALAVSDHLRRCRARQLGTCLHSLAELGVTPSERLWEALLDALCEDQAELLRAGNAVDVSVIALALARLNCPSRRAWRAVARGVEAHWEAMFPQHVANTLSALARGGAHEHRDAFSRLLGRAVAESDALSGRNLANALWATVRHLEALGALGLETLASGSAMKVKVKDWGSNPAVGEVAGYAAALARRLVATRMRQCPPTELAGVAWSLSRLGWMEGAAWEGLGVQLRLSAGALKPAELCTTAEALQAAAARNVAAGNAIQHSARSGLSNAAVGTAAAAGEGEAEPAAAAGSASQAAGDATPARPVTVTDAQRFEASPSSLVDPGEHLPSLFAAASLRIRELRPHHLARLLHVLTQRAAPQHTPQRQQQQPPQQQQHGGFAVSGAVPAGMEPQGALETQDPVFVGFVEAARTQLLRSVPSAFPDLAMVASITTSLTHLTTRGGGMASPVDGQAQAALQALTHITSSETAEPGHDASSSGGRDAPANAAESAPRPTATTAAVLDHLAAAATPSVVTAGSSEELRCVVAAFAAAGHFHAELCTAVAARLEALAGQVDISRIARVVVQSSTSGAQQQRRQRQQQRRDSAVAAAAGEVVALVGVLQALAQLGFHNQAALDAAQPAVAAAAAVLPPPVLVAALDAYTASGAPPLALASSLAATLLQQIRECEPLLLPLPSNLQRRDSNPYRQQQEQEQQRHQEMEQQQERSAGPVRQHGGGVEASEESEESPRPWGLRVLGLGERDALQAACRQWRASLLYPGGLVGDSSGHVNEIRGGMNAASGPAAGRPGTALRRATCAEIWGGKAGGAEFLRGFDRCSELVLSLQS